jgi:hypothetical protein
MRVIEMIGQSFDGCVVLRRALGNEGFAYDKHGRPLWELECSCGEIFLKTRHQIMNAKRKVSCPNCKQKNKSKEGVSFNSCSILAFGEVKSIRQWWLERGIELGLSYPALHYRLRHGWIPEMALTIPSKNKQEWQFRNQEAIKQPTVITPSKMRYWEMKPTERTTTYQVLDMNDVVTNFTSYDDALEFFEADNGQGKRMTKIEIALKTSLLRYQLTDGQIV